MHTEPSVPRPRLRRLLPSWAALGAFLVAASPVPARADSTDTCIASHEGAQRQRKAGALEAAYERLAVCAASTCPLVIAKDCARWEREIVKEIVRVDVTARDARGGDAKARVQVDGRKPTWVGNFVVLEPGAHTLSLEGESVRRALNGRAGEILAVSLELVAKPAASASAISSSSAPPPFAPSSPPPSEGRRTVRAITWALGGAGVLGLGAGTYFGASSLRRRGECETPGACSQKRIDTIDRDYVITDIALGAGLLLAVAAVYSYASTPLTLSVAPRAVVVGARF